MKAFPQLSDLPLVGADGPVQLARSMVRYKNDPAYIARYVRREFGSGPTEAEVRKMRDEVVRSRTRQYDALDREIAEREARAKAKRDELLAKRKADDARKEALAILNADDERRLQIALTRQEGRRRKIVEGVAFAFGVAPEILTGKSRVRRHVIARKVLVRLLRDRQIVLGNLSMPDIGRIVGDRDHSTIKHSLDTFDIEMKANPKAAALYERLKGLTV